MMWVEARKQERKIKGMLVDFRKRAERRRDFYEKFTQDPSQSLQLHGRPCKMHLEPASSSGAGGESGMGMMPWQGDSKVLIDRFDGRAHLDFIPDAKSFAVGKNESEATEMGVYDTDLSPSALAQVNYERYRILVQNDFLNVSEEKFLQQIYVEEKFGPVTKTGEEEKKRQLADKRVAINYTYTDSSLPTPLRAQYPWPCFFLIFLH
ncbi:unnamed protein product [Notodromas monacha]|uniref:Suppressor of white apricot N-terminal domain-containing protein n=1 Tax=Notodromas monacha TaxID=399045 RepID=A0A7R9G925_9CRUS|nr:unnamed protein product [Notodromas monacha]CAG0913821.1 unnamed protein product [Notodromas monacha]